MKTMTEYVDALKQAHNIPSDRQLAKYLGLSKQAVSHWKERGITVDPDTAWRIAEGIGADPLEVIAASEIERAHRIKDDSRAKVWTQRLRQISAAALVVFLGFFHAGDAMATPAPAAERLSNVYYVKWLFRVMGRLRRYLRSLHTVHAVGQWQPAF